MSAWTLRTAKELGAALLVGLLLGLGIGRRRYMGRYSRKW